MKKGIFFITLFIILLYVVILNLNAVNTIDKKEMAETAKMEKLYSLAGKKIIENTLRNKTVCQAVVSGTLIQPCFCSTYTYSHWMEHFKILKRAGINLIILQYVVELKKREIKTNYFAILDNLFKAAKNNGMKVVVGLVKGKDWWNGYFQNGNWRSKVARIQKTTAINIHKKYKKKYENTFTGWYWAFEIYTSTKPYEKYWASMMKETFADLTKLDPSMPVMLSPFISFETKPTAKRVYEQFCYIVNNAGFRKGDSIYLQDSFGIIKNNFRIEEIQEYTKTIKKAVDTNSNVKFGINIENFAKNNGPRKLNSHGDHLPASIDRFLAQLIIAENFSNDIISFSYFHFYNPLVPERSRNNHDMYLNYLKGKNIPYSIPAPSGGCVYRDSNRDEAPIPSGFQVSTNKKEQIIENGLVIVDRYGNEFVWIPVNAGVDDNEDNESYASEKKIVAYKKWCTKGASYKNSTDDINNTNHRRIELSQISKYRGFYIGRYESAFDYNGGNFRIAVKASKNNSATDDWRTKKTNSYDGYLWNFIWYSDAKTYSMQMAMSYSYDKSISTGLITGTQWDTTMKWLYANNININNSISWGNYANSIAPANTGNYRPNRLQNSGSNENWKAKNIYDLAGNLSEWSSEKNNSEAYIRSTDYKHKGSVGPASYRMAASTQYGYPNVGFRVVLYID